MKILYKFYNVILDLKAFMFMGGCFNINWMHLYTHTQRCSSLLAWINNQDVIIKHKL